MGFLSFIGPSNPTWIIVGSIAGGMAFIALVIVVIGLFICYSQSQKHHRATRNLKDADAHSTSF